MDVFPKFRHAFLTLSDYQLLLRWQVGLSTVLSGCLWIHFFCIMINSELDPIMAIDDEPFETSLLILLTIDLLKEAV